MPKWKRPKKPDPPPAEPVITEASLNLPGLEFPRSQTLSSLDKFWQEHRHEEPSERRRKRIDKDMGKYA